MIPVLTREEARGFDARAIDGAKVPSIVLMENAGRGATDAIERALSRREKSSRALFVVVCGTGNNGGDGFVVARHLRLRGHDVECFMFGEEDKLTKDARINRDAYAGVGGFVAVAPAVVAEEAFSRAAVIVDALFGTGLDRAIEGEIAKVIAAINASKAFTVALDVPSGLQANTGEKLGACVRADLTTTFAFMKTGLLTPSGRDQAGETIVCDIGVPQDLAQTCSVHASEPKDVAAKLPARALASHKYSAGHVAIVAGSTGKLGAALLASHATLRAGAGAATIVTWPAAAEALSSRVTEVMTQAIEGKDERTRATSVESKIEGKKALIVGPGFGTEDFAKKIVRYVVVKAECPLVLDADGLTAYAGDAKALAVRGGRAVLTPHAGELGRLLGVASEEIERDRYGSVRRAAELTKCVVLLKGPCTLIASPDGQVVVNQSGGPALATAGAGDVLSGIVGALLCTLQPFEAAWVGAHLHGAAADAWSREHGDRGLVAHEVADAVPSVIAKLRAG